MKKKYFSRIVFSKLGLSILLLAVCTSVYSRGLMFLGPKENEAHAVQAIKTISKLQTQYAEKNGGKFASNFDELAPAENLDAAFKGEVPVVRGYVFQIKSEAPNGDKPAFFAVTADPEVMDGKKKTGTMQFYYDSVVKAVKFTTERRQAKADDPSL